MKLVYTFYTFLDSTIAVLDQLQLPRYLLSFVAYIFRERFEFPIDPFVSLLLGSELARSSLFGVQFFTLLFAESQILRCSIFFPLIVVVLMRTR